MKPYYEDLTSGITIFNADCRDVLPTLDTASVDLVLTDPPYPNFDKGWDVPPLDQWINLLPNVRQFIFWSALEPFDVAVSAVHIWHKLNGRSSEHYERIFERNGQKTCRVFQHPAINSIVAAQMSHDTFHSHPTQKPQQLMRTILVVGGGDVVLDPFMGSGTTLRAAKDLGRKAIGIEIEERYCDIAVRRLQQEVFNFEVPA